MIERWSIMSIDESIIGVFETKEQAQSVIDKSEFDLGVKAVKIIVNDTPPDARTEELKEEIRAAYKAKRIMNLHISKGIRFYEQPINERLQFLLDMINGTGVFQKSEVIDNIDSHIETRKFDEEL